MKLVFESTLAEDRLRVEVAHPIVRPDNRSAYLLKLLRRGASRAPAEVVSHARAFSTHLGWPGVLVAYQTTVAARYQMFHFVAGVLIIADSEEMLTNAGAAIEEYILSARPDFRDEHPSLASLWS